MIRFLILPTIIFLPLVMSKKSEISQSKSSSNVLEGDRLGGGAINEKERKGLRISEENTDNLREIEGFDGRNLSHRLHALMGLDRYPNYLFRWNNIEDINELESALEHQLELVKKQKSLLLERTYYTASILETLNNSEDTSSSNFIRTPPSTWEELFNYFDPIAAKTLFPSGFFKRHKNISVEEILSDSCRIINLDPGLLEKWMDMDIFDVYSFPVLSQKVSILKLDD